MQDALWEQPQEFQLSQPQGLQAALHAPQRLHPQAVFVPQGAQGLQLGVQVEDAQAQWLRQEVLFTWPQERALQEQLFISYASDTWSVGWFHCILCRGDRNVQATKKTWRNGQVDRA